MPNNARAEPAIPWVESDHLAGHLDRIGASDELRSFAFSLRERGAAVVELGPEATRLCDRAVAETDPLFRPGANRVQDAWRRSPAVRALACDRKLQSWLDACYGRRSFPFQTLNFREGSQQQLHSDAIHFHTAPERFMCGVWIALEDVQADAGPLIYLPGSHRLPVLTMADAGVVGAPRAADYLTYVAALARRVEDLGQPPEPALLKKGQALVWTANLAHGGQAITRPGATRRSLVVHVYFDGCLYYTPMTSHLEAGRMTVRLPADVRSGGVRWPRRQGRLTTPRWRDIFARALDTLGRRIHLFS